MLEFSQNILLADGTQVNLYNTVEDFSDVIKDRLGYEACIAFNEIVEETRLEALTDMEADFSTDMLRAADEVADISDELTDIIKNNDRISCDKLDNLVVRLNRLERDFRYNTL